jgi:Zn-dependent M16 (insulinase) family peptidase
MLPIALTTCCPPSPTKTTTIVTAGGGGSGSAAVVASPVSGDTLDTLVEGGKVRGFTAVAVYLDDADKPLGARFMHDATGFTFDYLRIETAPQGFLWVNSFPTSDMGEPHTQEHLLLGKGDRGRKLGSSEAMALAESSAFTAQWRTAYHFHTVAGEQVFWPVMANHLDALLNPDYTDEEIRREVRNFGVDKADDGTLRLEEKGTVYNEMVRTYESPQTVMWRVAGHLVYGKSHPLALDSGGFPDAIREMTPANIRAFHAATHHLANMGMIGAFPSSLALSKVLDETGAILTKAAGRTGKVYSEAQLPAPAASPAGTIKIVEYPYASATNPGPIMYAWPATRTLDDTEHTLLGLFLDTLAGDESTPLYKKLIDGKTRVVDLGASGVWSYLTNEQGQPVYLGLSGVKSDKLDESTVASVRALIMAEMARIAALPDGDAELVAFVDKIKSRVIDSRRRLSKFLDTPPGFGFRGTGSGWNDHLNDLSKTKGFRKSLTLRPALASIENILAEKTNPFRTRLKSWGLTDTPFGVAAKPSPSRRTELDAQRKARIDAELARLQKHYATTDAASTLARYEQDYDAETKKLEATQQAVELPPLVSTPPMTLDDGLVYKTDTVANIPRFIAAFDSMASARVQLSFDITGAVLPADKLFLAALPTLLDGAGVIDNGTPIAADEMRDRMRKEILGLSIYYATNPRTNRIELGFAGSGNGADETKLSLVWMRRVMNSPDWRVENLPRLRDLVDQSVTGLRQAMLGAEEGWVEDPRDAWRHQNQPDYLHTSSFLTQAHDLHRLRWMLLDPRDAAATKEATGFLSELASAKSLTRAEMLELAKSLSDPKEKATSPKVTRWLTAAGKLSAKAAPLAVEAGKDLAAIVAELPDGSLAADWTYLCKQMAKDLSVGAPAALARLGDVRARIIQGNFARIVQTGSTVNHAAIAADVDALVATLPPHEKGGRTHVRRVPTDPHPLVDRLLARDPKAKEPVFFGLVAPSTSSGVFLNQAPNVYYTDTLDAQVIDYLASNLYTGHGAHSIFMKTWAAGLAYSNGLRPSLSTGVLNYYAERCPLLPQTLRFVIDELKKAKSDPNIARYAIATAFDSRIASGFEGRASAMAANLVDGLTPDVVKTFRTKILELSRREDLATSLFDRLVPVYSKVLPGFGSIDPKATYFVIGPEKQMAAYQDYLRAAVGKTTTLYRLYPRDFWIPAKI